MAPAAPGPRGTSASPAAPGAAPRGRRRAAAGLVLLAAVLATAACRPDADSRTAEQSAGPALRQPAAGEPESPQTGRRNLALGTGEAPRPEPFTLEQRFLDAVRRNDRAAIARALERGASIHARDDIGRSAVLLAVLDAGDADLVRWLHARGATLDDPDTGGRTPLSFAAERGHFDIVAYLVAHGAAVDRPDVQRRTPLFHAVLNDRRAVAEYLLDRGADVNARDQFGDTPLIVACAKGYGDLAALLLQRGADPALRDQEGRTAAERAHGRVPVCVPSPTP